jgi:hypothetical protein
MPRRRGTSGGDKMHFRDEDGEPWCRRRLIDREHRTTEVTAKVTCKVCREMC